MGIQVTFNYAAWQLLFPDLATVPQDTAQEYFNQAGIFHDNSGFGQPQNATVQLGLMNLMTAHLVAINVTIAGIAPSPLVGPISNASEGSVSVGVKVPDAPGTQGWLLTTKYGAQYWYASQAYRTMRIRVGPRRVYGAGPYGGWGGWR